jgi:hypothetical protein
MVGTLWDRWHARRHSTWQLIEEARRLASVTRELTAATARITPMRSMTLPETIVTRNTTVNTLAVPELACYQRDHQIVSYARREPGDRHWRGEAFADDTCIATAAIYDDPAMAVGIARSRLQQAG